MHSGCIPLGWKRHKYNSCHPLSLLHSCNPLSLPQCHSCSQLSSLPLFFAMAFFNVTGTVNMSQGKAIMTLTPEPDIKVTMTRPSTSQLLEKIGAGTVKVHDSRHPVAKRDLTTMMGTIQRQTWLARASRGTGDGEWMCRCPAALRKLTGQSEKEHCNWCNWPWKMWSHHPPVPLWKRRSQHPRLPHPIPIRIHHLPKVHNIRQMLNSRRWSVSSHVLCYSYICGQDVSRCMRTSYFPDAVLQ